MWVGPDYTAPIASTGVTYYTFPTSGTYAVQLTATDSTNGDQTVDDFSVQVSGVPPTLALTPDCPAAQCDAETVPVGTTTSLGGTITHSGTEDIDNVYVSWGDGGAVDSAFCGLVAFPGGGNCNPGSAVPGVIYGLFNPTPLMLTAGSGNTNIALSDSHTYASAGTYYATVTVTDQSGATVSRTATETVTDPVPTTSGLSQTSTPVGSSPSCDGHRGRLRTRLDRAVGWHPRNHDLRLGHEIDGRAPGHRHGRCHGGRDHCRKCRARRWDVQPAVPLRCPGADRRRRRQSGHQLEHQWSRHGFSWRERGRHGGQPERRRQWGRHGSRRSSTAGTRPRPLRPRPRTPTSTCSCPPEAA